MKIETCPVWVKFRLNGKTRNITRKSVQLTQEHVQKPVQKIVQRFIDNMAVSVYVVRSDPRPVKIGVSKYPNSRLSGLQTATHVPLFIDYVAKVDGDAHALEHKVHASLKANRCRGEWFDVSSGVAVKAIQDCAISLGYAEEEYDLEYETPPQRKRPRLTSQGLLMLPVPLKGNKIYYDAPDQDGNNKIPGFGLVVPRSRCAAAALSPSIVGVSSTKTLSLVKKIITAASPPGS